MTLAKTFSLLRRDYHAALGFFKKEPGLGSFISFLMAPGFMAVALHRFSHLFYVKGFHGLARIVATLCFLLTGADIHPSTEAGPGLVMLHTLATVIHGKLGENVTLTSRIYIGPDGSLRNVGAGPGLPVLGNRIFLGANCMITGARRISDDVVVLANSLVIRDVPAGAKVFGIPARVLGERRQRRKTVVAAPVFDVVEAGRL